MESRDEIRRRLRQVRDALTADEVGSRSLAVCRRLQSAGLLDGVAIAGLYAPVRNEVDCRHLFEECRKRRIRIVYPRVTARGLSFHEVVATSELEPGAWGISEPTGTHEVPLAVVDLVVVPGIAFDRRGYRLGYGKGYYDRALSGFQGTTVGVAYSFQVVPQLPHASHDLRCRWVVTEDASVGGLPSSKGAC